ncbi:MAG: FG-GAP-like repeat-containing protein [Terriglobales bacterium]|jgi:hypothetical protein
MLLICIGSATGAAAQSPPPATFTSASLIDTGFEGYYTPGAIVQAIAGGDFNGDGKPDLIAISNNANHEYEILLGNGNGAFSSTGINTLALRSTGDGINANNPNLIAVGDFNGDGKLDFAVYINGGQSGANYLDVYLGNGAGHFSFSNSYTVGNSGATGIDDGVVAADVNGDGKLDLLAINSGDNSVTVLLGNGDGTFQTGALYSACNRSGCEPVALTVGDFNNDGHPDLALVSTDAAQQSGIYILLNNGNGTFQSPVFYSSSSQMGGFPDGESGIASADLNGDGNLDLVMTNNAGAWVFLGNGDGTFQAPINYGAPYADTLALADVNGDKTLDLVVPDFYNSTVWVLLGNGDGTFKPAVAYATDWFPESIVVADFNDDGKLDFAVGSDNGPMITLAFGNGDGTFQTGPNYDIGNWTGQVAADFNNDGNLDVAVYNSAVLQVMLGNSHGGLGSPITTSMPGLDVTWMAAGDVNGDGKPDLVAANDVSNPSIAVFIGNGNGTFNPPVTYSTGSTQTPSFLVLADVNNDGKPDAIVSNADGSLSVLLNNGQGVFGTAIVTPGVSSNGDWLATGDFNGDGNLDLAIADYYGADFSASKGLIILLGNGNGTFQSPISIPIDEFGPTWVTVGDFNKDGKLDLAVGGYWVGGGLFGGGGLAILLGNGDGTFGSPTYYSLYPGANVSVNPAYAAVVADVNLDGNPDLLVPFVTTHVNVGVFQCCGEPYNAGVGIFLGKGDGTFEFENALGEPGVAGGPFLVGTGSYGVIAGDFNGDGAPDAAVLNQYNFGGGSGQAYVTILLNTTLGHGTNNGTTTTLTSSLNPAGYGQSVTFTATVATNEGGSPAGTVAFLDGGNQIGTGTLAGGQTALTISTLSAGSHSITAAYAPNGTFQSSNSATLTEVITAAQAAAPTFSKGTGTYTGTQSITMSTTAGTVICYNTSGAAMTVGSGCSGGTQYTGTAVAVSSSETLYAVAGGPGYTQSSVNSATYTINFYFTLTLTEQGNGTGQVTDNTPQINCSEANGIYTSSACSGTYLVGTTVTLTAGNYTPTGTTFGGWGGNCASQTGTTCSLTPTGPSALTATANFIAAPVTVPLTNFATPGTNVAGQATFACPNYPNPSPGNPCLDPNGHALQVTIPQVTSGMNVVVTETEFLADGLCPAGQISLGGKSTDFDCRLVNFYNYGLDGNGNAIVPLCYPYANGNCVSYRLSQPDGSELPAGSYLGGIFWKVTFNNDTFTPTGYWLGSTPRMLDDPGADEVPPLPYGTSCSAAMQTDNPTMYPGPYYCQFDNDITTFYNATEPVDSGIGGKTSQPNDVVIAFLPTSAPGQTPPSDRAPTFTSSTSTTFTVGTPGTFAITTTGGYPAPVLSIAAVSPTTALPTWLTFNSGIGLLTGTPPDGSVGPYYFTTTATSTDPVTKVPLATSQPLTLTVNQAAATVTLGNMTQTYTGRPLTPTATTNPPGLTIVWTGAPDTNVDSYPVTATVNDPNYQGSASGNFVINKATAGVTLSNMTQTYTGSPLTPTATTSPSGLTIVWTGAPDTNAGSYPVTATVSNANYQGSASGNFVINKATLSIWPSSLNFGTLYLRQSGFPQFVTVTNTGSTSVVISKVQITGGNAPSDYGDLSFCSAWFSKPPGTLPPGKSCVIGVDAVSVSEPIFSPNASTAYLAITPSGGIPLEVPLTVLVIDPQAAFSSSNLRSGELTFPTTSKGKTSELSITVTNPGTTPLTLGTPTISSRGGPFAVVTSATTCTGATIQPTGTGGMKSCVINVTFTPTATGTFTGTLKITDNAENSPQTITLSGTT